MHVSVTGKHMDVGEAFTQHATEALTGIAEKYFAHPLETQVILTKDKSGTTADIHIHVSRGLTVHGHAHGQDPYPVFEEALKHVETRLRKYKNRIRDHHKHNGSEPHGVKGYEYILAHSHDWDLPEKSDTHEDVQPAIVAEMITDIKTLTIGQAVMMMDLGNNPVVMFKNRASGHFNVMYRRTDGQIGWIDPEDQKLTRV